MDLVLSQRKAMRCIGLFLSLIQEESSVIAHNQLIRMEIIKRIVPKQMAGVDLLSTERHTLTDNVLLFWWR